MQSAYSMTMTYHSIFSVPSAVRKRISNHECHGWNHEKNSRSEKPVRFSKSDTRFHEGRSYTLTIERVGDEACAHLDGQTIQARHVSLKEHKTICGLQAVGLTGPVTFDNLKV
jgi:hypothetical protein